jgi:hypothetical protein
MANRICMTFAQRQALVEQYRKGADPRVRLRATLFCCWPRGTRGQ